jgi:hypothetical protein
MVGEPYVSPLSVNGVLISNDNGTLHFTVPRTVVRRRNLTWYVEHFLFNNFETYDCKIGSTKKPRHIWNRN